MKLGKTVTVSMLFWLVLITSLHVALNLNGRSRLSANRGTVGKFRVGFLPVTCHLTCPVTDFINRQMSGDGLYEPVRFNSWPELKEAYLAGDTDATFILAPMAMALREQGVPIKIVYLGHRDGTAVVVGKHSRIWKMQDLRGKRVAIPNRFSNQYLLIFRALKQAGMTVGDIQIVEMPPPDMPAALYAKAVDAICSGEPFMAQAEMSGYGRVLWLTKDIWPNFISCVLAVRDDVIETRRSDVQALVDGIAKSGKWLEQSMDHRMSAAQFVGQDYYMQDPQLLRYVLSKPPDRVKYSHLRPLKKDFEEIEALGKEAGILKGTAHFDEYTDTSFADSATSRVEAWKYEGLKQ